MKKSAKKIIVFVVCIAILGAGMSYALNKKNTNDKTKPKSLIIWTSDQVIRDPNLAVDESQNFYTSLLYEPLFLLDDKNELVPNIAKSYKISEDGTKITIDLNRSKEFSDGTAIKSDDVKRTLSRLNSLDGKFSKFIKSVKGSGEAKSGQDFFGIETPTDSKIVFSLIEPNPFFVYSLAQPNLGIIPSSALNEKNEIISDVGSGDYTIKTDAASPGDATVFAPRDKTLPTLNIFVKTQDEINAIDASSKVDIAFGQTASSKGFSRKNVHLLASASWNLYVKDASSPLSDVKFRKAVLLALDSKTSLAAYGDKAIKSTKFSGITIDSVDCSSNCTSDEAEAKELLKEIFPDGVIPNLPIDVEDTELQKALAATAQKELTDVGIPSTITVHDPSDWANVIARGEITLFRFGWVSDIPVSSDTLVKNFKASSADNLSGVVDTTLENDIKNYEASTNIKSKIKASQIVQERIKNLYLSKPIAQYVFGISAADNIVIPSPDCYGRMDINKIYLN